MVAIPLSLSYVSYAKTICAGKDTGICTQVCIWASLGRSGLHALLQGGKHTAFFFLFSCAAASLFHSFQLKALRVLHCLATVHVGQGEWLGGVSGVAALPEGV